MQTPLILHIQANLGRQQHDRTSSDAHLIAQLDSLTLDALKPPPRALLHSGSTIVTVRPRWSKSHPFPIALHDTLAAFDWMTSHLCPPSSGSPHRPIGVYGRSIGGTLATSLALTESRPGRRTRIRALAVHDAVFDWTHIATSAPPDATTAHDSISQALFAARAQLFTSPAACFDAYASPILFFRTSGLHVPSVFPSESPEITEPTSSSSSSSSSPVIEHIDLAPPSRRSNLVFPAKGSGLRLPHTRIAVTQPPPEAPSPPRPQTSPRSSSNSSSRRKSSRNADPQQQQQEDLLAAQAHEIAKLMQRSIALHELKERLRVDGEAEGDAGLVERRVSLVPLAPRQDDDAMWAVEFFGDVL